MHRYLYAYSNPARYTDPTGHAAEEANAAGRADEPTSNGTAIPAENSKCKDGKSCESESSTSTQDTAQERAATPEKKVTQDSDTGRAKEVRSDEPNEKPKATPQAKAKGKPGATGNAQLEPNEVEAKHTSKEQSYKVFTKRLEAVVRQRIADYIGIRPDQVRLEVVAAVIGQAGAESGMGGKLFNYNWGNIKANKNEPHYYQDTPEYGFNSVAERDYALRHNPYYGGQGRRTTNPLSGKPGIYCTGKTHCTRFRAYSNDKEGMEAWFHRALPAAQKLQAHLVLDEVLDRTTTIDEMAKTYKEGLRVFKWDPKSKTFYPQEYSSSPPATYAATIRNHLPYVTKPEQGNTVEVEPVEPGQTGRPLSTWGTWPK